MQSEIYLTLQFLLKYKFSQHKVYRNNLQNDDKRNADHKFFVLCFVSDSKHSKEHCHRAAERRPHKERCLGNSALSLACDTFIVNCNDY